MGKSSGRKPIGDMEIWWWNNEVQKVIKAKNEENQKCNISNSEEDEEVYKLTDKVAKRVLAKAVALNRVYEELETPEGQRKIFTVLKARNKAIKDLKCIKQMKDEGGTVLSEWGKIKDR